MGFKVTDAVTVAVAAATTLSVSVSDSFKHTDTVAAQPHQLSISVVDSFKHTDQVAVALDRLNLSVVDNYKHTDTVSASLDRLNLSVEDNYSHTDDATLGVTAAGDLNVSVADNHKHTDQSDLSLDVLNLSISDNYSHTDTALVSLDALNPSVADNYSYTDAATVNVSDREAISISVEDNYKHTDVTEVRSIPWYHAEALTINTGAISSGNLASTYADDGTELVLTEVTGTPGFSYDFTFGTDQQVPAYNLSFNLKGYYEGNVGHAVELRQYNYTTTNWDEVIADTKDFPHNTSEQTYNYPLLTAADYKSGGQLKLRIIHTTAGASTHLMHIDRMWLSSAEPNPSIADSYLFTESVALSIDSLHISVADGYFYSESPQASLDPLFLDVADSYSHTDAVSASLPSTAYSNLQIMSLKLSDKLSLSISVKGDCIPVSLLSGAPSGAPPAGRGLVAYVEGGTLKLAAWTGSAWVTT